MVEKADNSSGLKINRRKLLSSAAAVSAAGLAGCLGGDDERHVPEAADDDELGERVPEVVMEYWSDYGGFTTIQESMSPIIQRDTERHLGIEFAVEPVEFTTQTTRTTDNERDMDFAFYWHTNVPDRLDPNEMLESFRIDWAGANGLNNRVNYANCEYTEAALAQGTAETQEERDELLNEAMSIYSHDCVGISLTPMPDMGAWRSDMVDIDGVGISGVTRTNPNVFIKSEPTDGDTLISAVDVNVTEVTNFQTESQGVTEATYNMLINSPLIMYDENNELFPCIAEDWDVDPTEATVNIREDAVFHDGSDITASDVIFTFEQLARGSEAGAYPGVASPPYEEIVEVDDKTVEFYFEEPYPPFEITELARYGIWNEENYRDAGAVDDPGGAEFDEWIGSGPFELVERQAGEYLEFEPHEDHPVFDVEHKMIHQVYSSEEVAVQALESGDIHIVPEISTGTVDRVDETVDNGEADFSDGFMTYIMYAQPSHAPCKFEEFRKAIAASINRQELCDVAFRGEVDPHLHADVYTDSAPWMDDVFPEEDRYQMAEPEGSPEEAQQMLLDEGWGWDEDGYLHYPPDANLDPVWPEGEEPSEEDFPCLAEL